MEPARADVFCLFIDGCRDTCQLVDCIFPEGKLDSFCFEQSDVLLDKGVVRFCKNPDEMILAEGFELDPYRKSSLQFGDQIRRLRDVERAGCDKEDMLRLYLTMLRSDRRSFDYRQKVPLDAFPRNIRPLAMPPAGYLVDFIYEDDAGLFGPFDGLLRYLLHIDQLVRPLPG